MDVRTRSCARDAGARWGRLHGWLLGGTALAALGVADPVAAQEAATAAAAAQALPFDVPAQPLAGALDAFGRQSGLQIAVDSAILDGLVSQPVAGMLAAEEALARLLSGTGILWRMADAETVVLEQAPQGSLVLDPLTVEGAAPAGARFGDLPVEAGGFVAEYQASATKSAATLRETPQAVSVVTQDAMRARQVQDLGTALETVAGVNQFSGTGPGAGVSPFGFDEVQIRGMALDGAFDTREDGFSTPSSFSTPDLALYERIEAVKGPSSVLYGRGSAGGFVNRVRKRPLSEPMVELGLSAGSFDLYRADLDATGPFFASDRARGRLVTAYQDEGSFVDSVEAQRALVAPSLDLELTATTRLLLQGAYQKDNFIPNPGFPLVLDGGVFRAPFRARSTYFGVPNTEANEWTLATGTVQLDQEFGDGWLATLRLNRTSQDSPIRQDAYAYAYTGLAPGGDVTVYASAFDIETHVWSGDLRLERDLTLWGRESEIVVGVERSQQAVTRASSYAVLGYFGIYDDFFTIPLADPGPTTAATDIRAVSTGAYGQVHFRPLERLGILVGGRVDRVDSTFLFLPAPSESTKRDEATTGRVGATYDLTQEISAYALYAQSFSPNPFDTDRNGQILDPETGDIVEVGLKTEWLDGRLAATLAAYRLERDGTPIPDPLNGPGDDFSISGGLQRTEGLEFEVNGEPVPGWTVSLGTAFMDSEFVEQGDPFFGSRPAGTADWQVGLYTSYELQQGAWRGLGAGVGLFAIGNRGVSTFVTGAELEGYKRVDLQLFYNGLEGVALALQVRNVLDETYVEGADRIGAYAQFGAPRSVLLTGTVDF